MSVDRFLRKRADLATIFPAVAGPAIGGFAGRAIGAKLSPGNPAIGQDLGAMLGAITGGTAGQLAKETIEESRKADVPPGAPYALDATSADIPPWALQGAQLLQPAMKQAADDPEESPFDVVMGEVPGANPIIEGVRSGPRAGLRTFGGMVAGGVPGGLVGTGLAKGIEHLTGHHNIRVPGIGLSLSDVLGSIGGALGATKGMRLMQS